jgi:hypothetical protein
MNRLIWFGIHLLCVNFVLSLDLNYHSHCYLYSPGCVVAAAIITATVSAFTLASDQRTHHFHIHFHLRGGSSPKLYSQQLFSLEPNDSTMFNFIATQGAARVTSMFGEDESVVSNVDTSSTDDQDAKMYNSIFSADVVLQDASVSNGILNGTNIFLPNGWMNSIYF